METTRVRRTRRVSVSSGGTRFTAAEAIIAALHAETGDQLGDSRFSEADVVVMAWRFDPKRFGMPGFEQQYPDAKKVSGVLVKMQPHTVGHKPHNRLGWMERVRHGGPSRWRVTEQGAEVAGKLRKRAAAPVASAGL